MPGRRRAEPICDSCEFSLGMVVLDGFYSGARFLDYLGTGSNASAATLAAAHPVGMQEACLLNPCSSDRPAGTGVPADVDCDKHPEAISGYAFNLRGDLSDDSGLADGLFAFGALCLVAACILGVYACVVRARQRRVAPVTEEYESLAAKDELADDDDDVERAFESGIVNDAR